MTDIVQFYPLVRGRVPGFPEELMDAAIRDAAIEFCQKTQLITETLSVDVTAGTTSYPITPSEGTMWEVLRVNMDEYALIPVTKREYLDEMLDTATGAARYYYIDWDNSLVLGPVPTVDATLTIVVTIRPDDDSDSIPDILYQNFRESIAARALALIRHNHVDWANPVLEASENALFEKSVYSQKLRMATGGGSGKPLRVKQFNF